MYSFQFVISLELNRLLSIFIFNRRLIIFVYFLNIGFVVTKHDLNSGGSLSPSGSLLATDRSTGFGVILTKWFWRRCFVS